MNKIEYLITPDAAIMIALKETKNFKGAIEIILNQIDGNHIQLMDELIEQAALSRKEKKGYVYIIELKNYIKIGRTADYLRRLQSYPPHKVLYVIECDFIESIEIETNLRKELYRYLMNGNEYFSKDSRKKINELIDISNYEVLQNT